MGLSAQMVLLVDDDANDAFFIKSAINKAQLPVAVTHLNNGKHAIDYLQARAPYCPRRKHPLPDLVLLDLKMPFKNGFEVLQWIRSQRKLQKLPVVVLSSSEEEKDVKRSRELGATGFVTKMPLFSELVEEVRKVLRISGKA
jgi:DNA-binding response OmpR family regulator